MAKLASPQGHYFAENTSEPKEQPMTFSEISATLRNPQGPYFAENTPAMLALESMVDTATISNVLYALAHVCHSKAEHLAVNWQDATTAGEYLRTAMKLDKLAASKLPR
jgi:hypothetical protein